MILITGGLGFMGSNTAQAMLEMGESCVLTQHKNNRVPTLISEQVGKRIFIEPVDVTDRAGLLALGKKYQITGIVHLASGGGGTNAIGFYDDIRSTMASITNVFQAGLEWNVKRVSVASTLGVYIGVTEVPWREDQPLPLTGLNSLIAMKKCGEIAVSYLSRQLKVEGITIRFPAGYGPGYDATRGSLVGRLVHAAVKGTKPSLEGIRGSVYAADCMDQCYVKDSARAVGLLHAADQLKHQTYNVGSGRPTTNQDIVDAIQKVIPRFEVELPAGHMPGFGDVVPYQDITWLREDTGFEPQFDVETAVADYIAWLRAGNER
jgi:UDP-glucose 4-epimerase